MAETNRRSKRFYLGQPGTSITDLFTVAASKRVVVRNILIANTDDADQWISISIGTTGIDTAASRIVDKLAVDSASSVNHGFNWLDFGIVMEAGEIMTAKQQTASMLTVSVFGVEMDV